MIGSESAQVKTGLGLSYCFSKAIPAAVTVMPALILASTSPYRRTLLERFGVPFKTVAPGVAEGHLPGESPPQRALRLSLEKARAVALSHPEALVIGSDQVAAHADCVLDKPKDAARCRQQLRGLSGNTARFYTGCAVLGGAGLELTHLDTTTVVFRSLQENEIERYVMREQPYDCAGSFKAEGLGICLFERIESQDPSALIGLPLIWLAGALRAAGYALP
jgi:septum formation protein